MDVWSVLQNLLLCLLERLLTKMNTKASK